MVIFSKRAQAAIECANEMQRRVADDDDEIGLRVGLHAGELLRDGNDFFGSTVIIARRLCDRAESGQTHRLRRDLRLRATKYDDSLALRLGRLKGLSTPVESVGADLGTPAEEPGGLSSHVPTILQARRAATRAPRTGGYSSPRHGYEIMSELTPAVWTALQGLTGERLSGDRSAADRGSDHGQDENDGGPSIQITVAGRQALEDRAEHARRP